MNLRFVNLFLLFKCVFFLKFYIFFEKDEMAQAMKDYPDSCAVLVRRHGVYVWGKTWQEAKTMLVDLLIFFKWKKSSENLSADNPL